MSGYFVTSMTSSRKLPAAILKTSFFRKVFFLPWLFVEYEGTSFSQGITMYTGWYYPSDVGGYNG